MRAAWYECLGHAADVLTVGETETPSPGSGEVLVRVAASGINPSDTKKRAGWLGGGLEYPRVIPHSDGAGTVEATGEGVASTRVGERVWLYNAQHGRADGTAAEYVALPAELAIPLPDGVSFEEAACLGVPAQTAHYAVLWAGPVRGKYVLVQGGAGAVGEYAVQIATLSGAEVIATVSSDEKAAIAREAGAKTVLNYRKEPDLVAAILAATNGHGVDHIAEVDLGTNAELDAAIIAPRGTIGTYSSTRAPKFEFDYYGFGYKGARISFTQVYMLTHEERAVVIADLTQWMQSGALKHRMAKVFSLEQITEAHEVLEEGGLIGNVVVVIYP